MHRLMVTLREKEVQIQPFPSKMKYEILTEETIKHEGRTLYRIEYLDGKKGGFVESYLNLSQEGFCRVLEESKVYDDGIVSDDAIVTGNAEVYGHARVRGKARVEGLAKVYEHAVVLENTRVRDSTRIYGYSRIKGSAHILGKSMVYGNAVARDNCIISGNALVYGEAIVRRFARLKGNARVYGLAIIEYGILRGDMFKDMIQYIACSLNIYPINGFYYLYKKVFKMANGLYYSCYTKSFEYRDGKVAIEKFSDMNPLIDCGSGLHVSMPFYWEDGDTLIAVKVHEKDVITCQSGKLRVSKLEVIGEVKYGFFSIE